MNEYLLKTQSVRWKRTPEDIQVLTDLCIKANDHLAITGPNGSGKSRLLEILAGFTAPLHGEISIRTSRIGLIGERPENQLLFHNVERELLFPLENLHLPRHRINQMISEIVAEFRLHDILQKDPFLLSGGQKQLLVLAIAAVSQPDIYFIDQPLDYLDDETARFFYDWIKREQDRGAALVTASGDDSLLKSASQVIHLQCSTDFAGQSTAITSTAEVSDMQIELRGLVCGYPMSPPLFSPLTRTIAGGESILISGPMGSGKSTLAMTLAGIHSPVSGSILLDGQHLHHKHASSFYQKGIIYGFQYPENQMAMETFRKEIAVYRNPALLSRTLELLPLLGLSEETIDQPLQSLSHSNVRLLSLLLIIALNKPVVIMDEPFAGLDVMHADRLLSLLTEMKQTLIIIDHTGNTGRMHIDQEIRLPIHSS